MGRRAFRARAELDRHRLHLSGQDARHAGWLRGVRPVALSGLSLIHISSRDYAELEPVARAAAEVSAMRGELESLAALDDPEMRELAEEEIARLKADLPLAERCLLYTSRCV